jgi:hypothetical protein
MFYGDTIIPDFFENFKSIRSVCFLKAVKLEALCTTGVSTEQEKLTYLATKIVRWSNFQRAK